MHIEINAGGLGAFSISQYQHDIDQVIKKADDVISCFKAVKSATSQLSGGVGSLSSAYDEINARIAIEEKKRADADAVKNKSTSFVDLAVRVDNQVAVLVAQNKDRFYATNAWARPMPANTVQSYINKAWEWLVNAGKEFISDVKHSWSAIKNALASAWEGLKDLAEQAWEGIKSAFVHLWESAVAFYREHERAIKIFLAVVGTIAAIAIIVLCPASSILVAIATGAIKAAVIGAVIGAAIGAVTGGLTGGLKGAAQGAIDGALDGLLSGMLFGGIGGAGAHLGQFVQCASTLGKTIKTTATVTTAVSGAMGLFDTAAMIESFIIPEGGYISKLNAQAHSSAAYNLLQTSFTVVSTFTGGMASTMQCFVRGTLVLTPYGLRPIEQIQIGDLVMAMNVANGVIAAQTVKQTYCHPTDELVTVTINEEDIVTTPTHPFYVQQRGAFVAASELDEGELLMDADGHSVMITGKEFRHMQTPVDVYNLNVSEYHTYFVGNACVLVHNKCIDIINEDGSHSIIMEANEGDSPRDIRDKKRKCDKISQEPRVKQSAEEISNARKLSKKGNVRNNKRIAQERVDAAAKSPDGLVPNDAPKFQSNNTEYMNNVERRFNRLYEYYKGKETGMFAEKGLFKNPFDRSKFQIDHTVELQLGGHPLENVNKHAISIHANTSFGSELANIMANWLDDTILREIIFKMPK